MNNVMEARIEEIKGKLDATVLQDCFLVYSLHTPTVLRKIFVLCPLVADTGRLKNSMKYFYLKGLAEMRDNPKLISTQIP